MTTATKLAGKSDKSAIKGGTTQGSRSSSPDKDTLKETAAEKAFDPDPVGTQADQNELEDQLEEERLAEE